MDLSNEIEPVECEELQNMIKEKIIDVSAGAAHTVLLTGLFQQQISYIVESGKVYCFGRGHEGQLASMKKQSSIPLLCPFKEPIVSIVSGLFHNVALSKTGKLYCWGIGLDGPISWGGSGPWKVNPTLGHHLPWVVTQLADAKITHLACNGHHALVNTDKGLYGMGLDDDGELGTGGITRKNLRDPVPVLFDDFQNIVDLQCGSYFSMSKTKQ